MGLKSFVVEYVRERGNRDASEVLDDYMLYLRRRGYIIRRSNRSMAQTDHASHLTVEKAKKVKG
jgi:glutamate synthase domain-containing protein 3